MNLLLFDDGELSPDGTLRLRDRRAEHAAAVLRIRAGDRVAVGRIGGEIGEGRVLSTGPGEVVLAVTLGTAPPPPSPVELLLALPRPKILRRVLQAAASMGVKRLALVGSWRVEKSYFSSPLLAPEALSAQLRLGLEQGRDTRLPEVLVRRHFKPFVEDELDPLFPDRSRLLAHPAAGAPLETLPRTARRVLLAIGPEGGWTPYEAGELGARGFLPFSLGPRALRVDAAVAFAVGQAELWLRSGGR